MLFFFFSKQKTAYEMRISDWSSDVCSSDLVAGNDPLPPRRYDPHRYREGAAMTFRSIGALLALAIAVSFAPSAPAQQQPAGQVAPQAFNVRDADIRAFIEDVARATGSTFIVDPSVQGTVNFSKIGRAHV